MSPEDLQRWELFSGLEQDEIEEILQAGRTNSFRRGATIFRQGEPADTAYLLLQGRAKLTEVTADGKELLLLVVMPGEFFGCCCVLDRTNRQLSAVMAEDGRAVQWSGQALIGLLARFPALSLGVLRLVARELQGCFGRYRDLATLRVEQRIAAQLVGLGERVGRRLDDGLLLDVPLTRQEIADMTGSTVATVSRMLSRWRKAGLVRDAPGRRLVITDAAGLAETSAVRPDPSS